MSAELLLDNSAWARLDRQSLSQQRADEVAELLESGKVAICMPFLLEAGYPARSGRDHNALMDELLSLPQFRIDDRVEVRAIEVQRQLARVGHHRLPPVDLIVASMADIHHLGILHYDSDYDLLSEKTDLQFESVWLADRGSL